MNFIENISTRAIARILPTIVFACILLFLFGARSTFRQTVVGTNLRVRTITTFVQVDTNLYKKQLQEGFQFHTGARNALVSQKYEVQTIQIATQPFPEYTRSMSSQQSIAFFKFLDGIAATDHIRIVISSAMTNNEDYFHAVELLGGVITQTKLNGRIAIASNDGVHCKVVSAAARMIKYLSEHSEANFRFAATGFVPAFTPFFPGAHHSGTGHTSALDRKRPM